MEQMEKCVYISTGGFKRKRISPDRSSIRFPLFHSFSNALAYSVQEEKKTQDFSKLRRNNPANVLCIVFTNENLWE